MYKKILFAFLLFVSGIVNVCAQDFTSVYFDTNEAYIDDIIDVTFERNEDKKISEIKGYFAGDNYYTIKFEDVDTDELYFIVPDYFKEGKEYQLTLLDVVYEDGTEMSYPVKPITGDLDSLETDSSIIKILKKPVITKFELIGNGEFDIDGTAKFNIEYTGDLDFATMIITNSDDSSDMHLLSFNIDGNIGTVEFSSDPVFKVLPGNYYVSDIYLNPSNNGYVHYSVGDDDAIKLKKISFKIIGEVNDIELEDDENIDKSVYEFNLDDLTADILKDLKKLNNDAVITVNILKDTLVTSKIFDSIINTDKYLIIKHDDVTWEFDGKKIINPKMIDVGLKISLLTNETSDKYLSSVIKSNSVLLNFAENGKLPGEVLIKINATVIDAIVDNKKLYIYYYDEKNNKLISVESGIKKNDNEYEFTINHNSKYIITSEKITQEKNKTVKTIGSSNNKKGNNNLILYIIIIICIIGLTALTIFIVKMKKKNRPSFLEDTTVISIENIETKNSSIDNENEKN